MSEAEARPFLEEGERHLQSGDFAVAERAFTRAVELAPDSAVAHNKLGVVFAHQRRFDEAISRFNRAAALAPVYAPAYSNLGNAYREKGQLAEALAAYQRAVAIDPDYWVAHQNLGILYKQMGRVAEAVEHFKQATRLSARRAASPVRGRRRGCLPMVLLAVVFAAALVLR
jgi:Flp pilus assembly protein TadD